MLACTEYFLLFASIYLQIIFLCLEVQLDLLLFGSKQLHHINIALPIPYVRTIVRKCERSCELILYFVIGLQLSAVRAKRTVK